MIKITLDLLARLKEAGIECFLKPGGMLPDSMVLQPPCSLKWMSAQVHLSMGAFSYAVSGHYFNVTIGRYTSIGEDVQVGRGDHPTTWVSTSPAFYLKEKLFEIGSAFDGAGDYHGFRPTVPEGVQATVQKRTVIGNDVYIGHGAFIRPGVTIGDGAIVGASAVVVKDVPPFAVVAGNPAAIKKFRVPAQLIGALLNIAWWRFAPWQLTSIDLTSPSAAVPALRALLPTLKPYAPTSVRIHDLATTHAQ